MSRRGGKGEWPLRAILLPSYKWNPYQRLLAAALRDAGVRATAIHDWPKRAPILGAWWARGRPQVVHIHWIDRFIGGSEGAPSRRNLAWFDWQLRILKLLGVRLVWTVHNLKGHEAGDDPRGAEANRRIIERADAIILHCEAARTGLIELYQPSQAALERMHVLAHGSYVERYAIDADQAEARAQLDLPPSGRVFAFVGSIRGYKGVGELIEAFAGRSDLGPDARLLIAGQPLPKTFGPELEERVRDTGDGRITLRLGRMQEDELSTILRAADVVVLPFRNILTSGSAILALSHGRPVIAPAMGCLPETMPDDATFLYDPDAPEALAEALGRAATADLAGMGQRARAYADTLDWGSIAEETARLYRG